MGVSGVRVGFCAGALLLSVTIFAPAARAEASGSPAVPDVIQNEQSIIAAAHDAASRDNDGAADADLVSPDGMARGSVSSAVFAQRAAGLCAWLRSDGDYGRAIKVARRAIARLAGAKEGSDADRVERLYWEAMLQADTLDNKKAAFALLRVAEKLAPDDQRISACELQLAQAMGEFGR